MTIKWSKMDNKSNKVIERYYYNGLLHLVDDYDRSSPSTLAAFFLALRLFIRSRPPVIFKSLVHLVCFN